MTIHPVDAGRSAAAAIERAASSLPTLRIPRTRAEVRATFGEPGSGTKPIAAWERANIVTCRDVNGTPGLPSMPGVPAKFYFQCHRLVEPIMREAFARAKAAAPGYQIQRAASYVFRHERWDPKRPLSLHAWGIAIDIDAETNGAHDYGDAAAPAPWSEAWMKRWPHGLPRAFVEAMEGVGFVWGGRWRSYSDGMHFQYAKSTA